ncbi:hypothetical protein V8B97DRAFT_157765 [Scleroderma yunnanense]
MGSTVNVREWTCSSRLLCTITYVPCMAILQLSFNLCQPMKILLQYNCNSTKRIHDCYEDGNFLTLCHLLGSWLRHVFFLLYLHWLAYCTSWALLPLLRFLVVIDSFSVEYLIMHTIKSVPLSPRECENNDFDMHYEVFYCRVKLVNMLTYQCSLQENYNTALVILYSTQQICGLKRMTARKMMCFAFSNQRVISEI